MASPLWESPSRDEGQWQPCTFLVLEPPSPALLNSVVFRSTCKIVSIKYSPNSSTFPYRWRSGTQQWSSLAKLPSASPTFRMGQFWKSWWLHLRFSWAVETDEINIKWWHITAQLWEKPCLGCLESFCISLQKHYLKSDCHTCLEQYPSSIRNLTWRLTRTIYFFIKCDP